MALKASDRRLGDWLRGGESRIRAPVSRLKPPQSRAPCADVANRAFNVWTSDQLVIRTRRLARQICKTPAMSQDVGEERAQLLATGNELRESGNLVGAESALRQAAEGSDQTIYPAASLSLGEVLYQRGDAEGAASEWHIAARAEDPQISVPAVINYGHAISEYEFSTESVVGKHRNAPLIGGFDAPRAEQMWLNAAKSSHPDAAWAWIGLGRVRAESSEDGRGTGNPQGAEEAFGSAIASGHRDAAPFGRLKLGLLFKNRGSAEQAIEVFRQGFESNHEEWAPRCAWFLGLQWAGLGNTAEAEAWWKIAANSGRPAVAELGQRALSEEDSIFRAGLPKKRGFGRFLRG